MTFQEIAAIFIVLAPGLAAVVAGLGQRFLGDKGSMAITTTIVIAAAVLAGWQFFAWSLGGQSGAAHTIVLANWLNVNTFIADWAIRIDALSVTMMFVVTSVSAIVHTYSIGYMSDDPHRARFFAYLSLFTFAMLMLVTSDNFIQMFFGWEGVGVASYLLIGFWYKKASANSAAIKAFVVNRVGDFGFALGIFGLFFLTDSVNFDTVFAAAPELAQTNLSLLWGEWNAANLLGSRYSCPRGRSGAKTVSATGPAIGVWSALDYCWRWQARYPR